MSSKQNISLLDGPQFLLWLAGRLEQQGELATVVGRLKEESSGYSYARRALDYLDDMTTDIEDMIGSPDDQEDDDE
jgi:hypothetical protein